MPKFKLNKNLDFIWYQLMNSRSRNFAKHALFRVLLGSAMLIAVPYAIGFFVDGLTTQMLDVLIIGGILFVSLELSNTILGWLRQQVREQFFQESFWYMPQSITKLYYLRPLSWLSGGTAEIDGGGVESLKEKVWDVTGSYIFQIIPGWGQVVFGLIACTYANLWLGCIALMYIIIERNIGLKENEYLHTEMRPVIDLYKRWERRMQEWWRSSDHVKSQGVETKVLKQIKIEVQDALKGDNKIWRIYFSKAIVRHRLRSLTFAMALYSVVGYLVFHEHISLAVAVLVFFSFERIRSVLLDLNDQQREVQFNVASIAKYRRVLSQIVPFSYNKGLTFNGDTISIIFDGVSHEVGELNEQKLILRNVCLSIGVGEKIGIVGPSGAGKSQLLSLLVRAADPVSGNVLISGTNLCDLRLESLLRYYGVIMQKSEPFEDSILGNLLFGVSHFDLHKPYEELSINEKNTVSEMALSALKKAGLDSNMFPNGIHTSIGYKGLKLSGGQQQRLQIAAAHMKLGMSEARPRLIIADEPTSSLDSLSELTVMEHLQDNLPSQTTMLMVAHRLSTVAKMDRIVFVRPLELCGDDIVQVTEHISLVELYRSEALFREMADAQGFRP